MSLSFIDLNLRLPEVPLYYLLVPSDKANLHLQVRLEVALYKIFVLAGPVPMQFLTEPNKYLIGFKSGEYGT